MALSGQVIVICGPTGAGKSGVAVQLCRAIVQRKLAPRAEVWRRKKMGREMNSWIEIVVQFRND